MRDFTRKAWFPLAVLMLMPWIADAAGLGRLSVLSSMGQPLRAEIELLSVQKEELATLSVRLASPDDYRKANLQFGAAAAGVRLSIERHPDGRPYILATSQQSVNDPFVDLLIELNWASGRLMREYTVLLDPPEYAAAAPQPAPMAVAPAVRPAPPPPLVAAPTVREPAATGTYGPIQRGETLGAIARSLKPDDVTLEQMLVGIYRSNPDAFIRKNMNLVRSGKILRVPDRQELAAISREEAVREYRAQVADWNAYRARLAEAVPTATEARTAAAGRITGRVEDKAAAEPKEVVRLSKGEAPGALAPDGKPRAAADRIRTLEEELVAREKALDEAKERIAQLEKTIRDMQRLAELKSPALATAQQQAEAKLAPKPEAAPKTKPEAGPQAEKAAEAKPAPKPEAKPEPAKPAPKSASPKPLPPPPEPSLMDTLTDPLYLGAGGGIVVLLLAYLLMRRRRAAVVEAPEKTAPVMSPSAGAGAAAAASATAASAGKVASPAPAAAADEDLDPVAEAAAYMSLGRDAQAEEVLKEALEKGVKREEVHVKLLEIYAARKDKGMFGKYAVEFNRLTGGRGPNWLKVAAMGYALEPENALYAAGREVIEAAPAAPEPAAPVDLDFNLDMPEPAGGATASRAEEPQPPGPLMPDFNLEVPADAPAPREPAPAAAPSDGSIDFNLELPAAEAPPKPAAPAQPAQDKEDAGLDFKLDISGLDLELGDKPRPASDAGGGKDAHWYDVQTKFDLARAYQEMGDRSGAREILEEVLKEGDAEQQEQARKLLETLG